MLLLASSIVLFYFALPPSFIWPDTVIIEAKSPTISACIVSYVDNILGTRGADLIIRSAKGNVISRTQLLKGMDCIEDIQIEFSSMEIRSKSVYITSVSNHYNGKTEFVGE